MEYPSDHVQVSNSRDTNEKMGCASSITDISSIPYDMGILMHVKCSIEYYLHACVVEGDEGGQEIQVARGEH